MTKLDHRVIFLIIAGFLFIGCFQYTNSFSDNNLFLKEFVGPSLLSVLGFITAITIAAVITVHLHLNNLADATPKNFTHVKGALNKSATSLIVVFVIALAVVTFKASLPDGEIWQAMANWMAICLILFDLSIMLDISRMVLKIPPAKEISK